MHKHGKRDHQYQERDRRMSFMEKDEHIRRLQEKLAQKARKKLDKACDYIEKVVEAEDAQQDQIETYEDYQHRISNETWAARREEIEKRREEIRRRAEEIREERRNETFNSQITVRFAQTDEDVQQARRAQEVYRIRYEQTEAIMRARREEDLRWSAGFARRPPERFDQSVEDLPDEDF